MAADVLPPPARFITQATAPAGLVQEWGRLLVLGPQHQFPVPVFTRVTVDVLMAIQLGTMSVRLAQLFIPALFGIPH